MNDEDNDMTFDEEIPVLYQSQRNLQRSNTSMEESKTGHY